MLWPVEPVLRDFRMIRYALASTHSARAVALDFESLRLDYCIATARLLQKTFW